MAIPPPIDPELQRVLDTTPDVVTTLLPTEIEALRARAIRPSLDEMTLSGAFELTVHRAQRTGMPDTEVVLLRPTHREGALPVLFHVHGGGMIVGSAYDELPSLARFAVQTGVAVAAVEYRLAPEHLFPAAVEDVYTGLSWTHEHATELGLDAERIVLHGVSAGGGLAAATALLARDRTSPAVFAQMLLCPMLDARNDSASGHQMAGLGAWDRTANDTGWSAYLGDQTGEVSPYASPALAEDLSGLPPTFIDVGSAETFRDEDIAYAERIWAAGGHAELHVWAGGVHGFDALAPEAVLSQQARAARVQWLTRLLENSRVPTPQR